MYMELMLILLVVRHLSVTKQQLDAKLARHCHHEHSVVSNLHKSCGSCWASLHYAVLARAIYTIQPLCNTCQR